MFVVLCCRLLRCLLVVVDACLVFVGGRWYFWNSSITMTVLIRGPDGVVTETSGQSVHLRKLQMLWKSSQMFPS